MLTRAYSGAVHARNEVYEGRPATGRASTNAAPDEKNAKQKKMIQEKTREYMDRAEKLKKHLDENDESNRKKPSAMGANGKSSGGAGKKCVRTAR